MWGVIVGGGGGGGLEPSNSTAKQRMLRPTKYPDTTITSVKDLSFQSSLKKVTVMSVDTDKGIDDLPPDADTIRDPTHTPFSWWKNSFYFIFYWSFFH
jgi:hypothetical protein